MLKKKIGCQVRRLSNLTEYHVSNFYRLQYQRGKCSLYFLVDETTKKVDMGWGIKKKVDMVLMFMAEEN